jgi:hypothetical protein
MRRRRTRQAPLPRSAFAGFRYPSEVIVLAVRWYLRFGLSYRDVEELLAERDRHAPVDRRLDRQLVMATPQVLDQGMAGAATLSAGRCETY